MASKASREEKTKAKNSSCDRLADTFRAMVINENLQSVDTAGPNMLSPTKRRDCHEVDWTKDIRRVDGGIIPSPISPVRRQGNCVRCLLGCSIGVRSRIGYQATRINSGPDVPVPPLSVQQILDCASSEGCEGGSAVKAYTYILRNGGLASEETYGYTEKNGTCDESRASEVAGGSIMAFVRVRPPTEKALEEALCRGPVTAEIAADDSDFLNYSGVIFRGACGEEMDHIVLVVGFGEEGGTKLLEKSEFLGRELGRMSYEAGERCRITQKASFPLVNLKDFKH